MKKLLLSVCACATATFSILPNPAFAQSRNVQIIMTDQGFAPSNVMTVINQQVNIHIINKGNKIHQFSIPYYRIFTENLKPGAASNVSFSPWESGQFDMISDPHGTGTPEFGGKFIVTDSK